ncbi:PRP38 family-domain-containing protein [Halteromyces radiatus]|uniref:PRP38 family-domain-containing protein n=1 Tax=Halteromyces radiatus TaxID=101107 RepID=UPI00221FEE37|nr:PRP38 family-domain-containing protein [Halteromyces radiatus]KAI8090022.1 PRP38 family-domain-containing protein [Halteromyces radiatus]
MSEANRLETWGNEETMNMNPIIYQNILESRYFKALYEKSTFHEVINEIYNEVTNMAPFVTGTTPSTAFCCLYKLWTMRLTIKQLEHMIDHKDSVYIRAVGFMYLRYVCAPAQLWDWLGYYLDDEEEINVANGPKPHMMTIGGLCRMLLTEQKYFGTMLPRIPVPIARDLEQMLIAYDKEKTRDTKGDQGITSRRSRSRSPSRSSRRDRSRSPSRRHRRRSPSPYHRRRHDSKRRDERDELDDYERRSRRRHDSHRRREERDELDDYERRRRRYERSRSRDDRRSRYSDDDSSDDDRRRRQRRRSPSVTRDRQSEYRGSRDRRY